MKYYVFGTYLDVNGYEFCVQVDMPSTRDYSLIKKKAIDIVCEKNQDIDNNNKYHPYEVVSSKWVKLFEDYKKLYKYCVYNNLFDGIDENLGHTCNGYSITDVDICKYGIVILDDYKNLSIPIYYLNEEEFGNVIKSLKELIKKSK